MEVLRQTARDKNLDISRVEGTKLTRDYIPAYMK